MTTHALEINVSIASGWSYQKEGRINTTCSCGHKLVINLQSDHTGLSPEVRLASTDTWMKHKGTRFSGVFDLGRQGSDE